MRNKMYLSGSIFILLIAIFMCCQGVIYYKEILAVKDMQHQRLEELTKLETFLEAHSDLDGYENQLYQKIFTLQKQLPSASSSKEILQTIQISASQSNISVQNIKIGKQEVHQQNIAENLVQIKAQGEYMALINWLNRLNRKQFYLTKLKISQTELNNLLQAEVEIKLYSI